MKGLKNCRVCFRFPEIPCLYNIKTGYYGIAILFVSIFVVSCSSMNLKTTPENSGEDTTDNIKIVSLESQLAAVETKLAKIKLLIEKRDKKIEQLQAQIEPLEKNIAFVVNSKTKDLNAPDLYRKARNLLIEENYITAAALFTELTKRFPNHTLAGNAAYWLGECHYSLNQYQKAVTIFKNLVITYPKSRKVPGALLKTGYAYLSLDDSNRASHYLKKVLRKYPFSPAAEKAEEKLKSFE